MMSFQERVHDVDRDVWIILFSLKGCHVVNVFFHICLMLWKMFICYNKGTPLVSICKQVFNCFINILTSSVIFISALGI